MTGYVTGDNNLVLSDGTYDYQYDAEGNRTRRTHIASGEVTEYDWDHRNRLTRVTVKASDQGPVTKDILYDYDVFNRLVGKTVAYDTDPAEPEDVTYFVYDGERRERGNAGDHLALVFDGNGDLTNRYLYGPAVDQILADEQLDSLTTPGDSPLAADRQPRHRPRPGRLRRRHRRHRRRQPPHLHRLRPDPH
jgi:hypothetical protein